MVLFEIFVYSMVEYDFIDKINADHVKMLHFTVYHLDLLGFIIFFSIY